MQRPTRLSGVHDQLADTKNVSPNDNGAKRRKVIYCDFPKFDYYAAIAANRAARESNFTADPADYIKWFGTERLDAETARERFIKRRAIRAGIDKSRHGL